MKTKSKQILQFILFLSLGIFLLWYTSVSLSKEEKEKVANLFLQAKLNYVIPCILVLIFSHFIRALRWKMMMDELGNKPGVINVFLAVLVGYFLNLVFPRLGEVAKCTLLGKYEKMQVDQLIGTIVAERIIDLVCLILVITLTILFQLNKVGAYAEELVNNLIISTNDKLLTVFLSLIFIVLLTSTLFWLFRRSKWLTKLGSFFVGIKQGLLSVQKIKQKGLFWGYTLMIWFLYLASIRIGFYSLPETELLSWVPSLTVLTFGSFAMIATQGGVGAYQLAVQKTLVLYNLSEVVGLAFGWLLWSVQTIMLLIVGPISMLLLYVLNKSRST